MWFKTKTFATVFSLSVMWCSPHSSSNTKDFQSYDTIDTIESAEMPNDLENYEQENEIEFKDTVKNQISLCLKTDSPDKFTYTKILESVEDPENTILEFPMSPLFNEYENRNHPLREPKVDRDFGALMWEWWIENTTIPQKLKHRSEKVTSETKYEIWDTLAFMLINPLLKDSFSRKLSDQLQEEGFETFSDPDALALQKKIESKNQNDENINHSNFIYDIVVKKLPSWKSALALYRDWELFMATYVSVWLPFIKTRKWYKSAKTKTWQFKIGEKEPYRRSWKYNNAPMSFSLNIYLDWFFHQWIIRKWYPLSHWCVRVPGIYANILFSLARTNSTDVFISKTLYNTKK